MPKLLSPESEVKSKVMSLTSVNVTGTPRSRRVSHSTDVCLDPRRTRSLIEHLPSKAPQLDFALASSGMGLVRICNAFIVTSISTVTPTLAHGGRVVR